MPSSASPPTTLSFPSKWTPSWTDYSLSAPPLPPPPLRPSPSAINLWSNSMFRVLTTMTPWDEFLKFTNSSIIMALSTKNVLLSLRFTWTIPCLAGIKGCTAKVSSHLGQAFSKLLSHVSPPPSMTILRERFSNSPNMELSTSTSRSLNGWLTVSSALLRRSFWVALSLACRRSSSARFKLCYPWPFPRPLHLPRFKKIKSTTVVVALVPLCNNMVPLSPFLHLHLLARLLRSFHSNTSLLMRLLFAARKDSITIAMRNSYLATTAKHVCCSS